MTLPLRGERLELPDGDFVDLCWTVTASDAVQTPVIAVFHGLEGSIHSPYAMPLLKQISDAGWQGVFMHFRGCSGEPNRLERSYHSGDTGDIRYLLESLSERYPGTPLFAVGYSLGGNALLKYLGESQKDSPLQAAVAVSVPFTLADGALSAGRRLRTVRDAPRRKGTDRGGSVAGAGACPPAEPGLFKNLPISFDNASQEKNTGEIQPATGAAGARQDQWTDYLLSIR